jgi:transcriptional regulator with XRE-family HTH domain
VNAYGSAIRRERIRRNLTQRALGKKVWRNDPDPQARIAELESGKFEPKLTTLRRLAQALGCDISELVEPSASRRAS